MFYEILHTITNFDTDKSEYLLDLIESGEIGSNREGAKALGVSYTYYLDIRKKTYDLALNNFIGSASDTPGLVGIYNQLDKEFAIFKILRTSGNSSLATKFGRELLKKSKKYERTEITIGLLRGLMIYASFSGSNRERGVAKQLAKELEHYQNCQYLEIELEKDFSILSSRFSVRASVNKRDIEFAKELLEKVSKVDASGFSLKVIYFKHLVIGICMAVLNELEGVVKNGKEALLLINTRDRNIIPYANIFSFHFRSTDAYIKLGKYQEALSEIDKSEYVVNPKNRNKFLIQIQKATTYLHMGDYKEALHVINCIRNNDRLNEADKELKRIYRAYAGLLTDKTVRIGKLMNETPQYSKDKRGFNITIISLQILKLIKTKQYGKVIDKIKSLESYHFRHLRTSNTYRSNLWISFLITLAECSFNPIATKRKAEKYINGLRENPIRNYSQSLQVEPVPYLDLVDLVFEWID